MDFQQRLQQIKDETDANHSAIMDKFKADAESWGSNLKDKRLLERNTSHVRSLNRIQQNHASQIEALNNGSQQRIDKYREDAQQRIEQARADIFNNDIFNNDIPNNDEPDFFYDEEPGPNENENDDISNELLNRMNDNE